MTRDHATDLGRSRFVLLTTFRATGEPVPTPVWIVGDSSRPGGHLAILTNLDSGKVRRLRRDPTVTLIPCNPQGQTGTSARLVHGRAEVVTDPDVVSLVWTSVRRKYAVEHLVIRLLGLVRPAWRRWDGPQAVLRLALDPEEN